jgi:hypothetical protein
MLAFLSTATFANDNGTDPNQKLRSKIVRLIGIPDIAEAGQEVEATISFTINKDQEIVVLHVNTDNSIADRYIKSKLNYNSVDIDGLTVGEKYFIKIKFRAE